MEENGTENSYTLAVSLGKHRFYKNFLHFLQLFNNSRDLKCSNICYNFVLFIIYNL